MSRPAASAAGPVRPKRFRSPAWARFRANRRGWWSLRILCALYALSLFSELISNDRPLVLRVRGRTFFPALFSYTQDDLLGDGVRRPVRDFAPILARPDAHAVLAPFPSGAHTVFEPSALDAHLRPVSAPAAHWPVAAARAAVAPDGALRWEGAPWGDADRFAAALAAPPPAALRAAVEARAAGRAAPAFECAEGGVSFRLAPAAAGRPAPAARVYLRAADWRTAPPEPDPEEGAAPLEPAAFPFRPILPGHPFGFDEAGRDVFAQVLYGTRTAVTFGLLLTLASLLLGIVAGAVQGWFVRWVDVAGQRLTEIWSALPFLYVMILLGNEFGRGFGLLLVCYALFNWIGTASYVRAEFLRLRTRAFADAARVQGLGAARIMFRHLLPNALTPLVTLFPFLLVGAIGSLAALDYLGFGLPEDAPSWGNLLRQAQAHRHAWWLILFPSLALFAVMLLGVFVGEGLRDAFDPRPVTALDDPRADKARRRRRRAPPDDAAPAPGAPLLEIDGLRVSFDTAQGEVRAVDGVSLSLAPGETLGLVGESGCGKSVTAMSVLRLVPSPPGRLAGGSIRFEGRDLSSLPLRELRKIRGAAVGMVFQDPMTALSPLHRIGDQLLEAIRLHRPVSRREGLALAERWLARCGIADPKRCLREYPFRLSGGMQQRVMIASVLMTDPRLIIADEPTTALDVTVQAQVLDLMRSARSAETALLLITHNMAVVRSVCSRVAVMYAGRIVETGPVDEVFARPRHPYTAALLAAMPGRHAPGERLPAIPGSVPSPLRLPPGCRFAPRCSRATPECAMPHPPCAMSGAAHAWDCLHPMPAEPGKYAGPQHEPSPASRAPGKALPETDSETVRAVAGHTCPAPVLSARGLFKRYPHVVAVSDVSLDLRPGETLAVVGESGSGKTTLARLIAGLEPPSSGELLLDGRPLRFRRTSAQRRDLQMVFQDPFSSLNPRHRVADLIAEAPRVHGLVSRAESRAFALHLLERVGLPPEAADRYPHEFSGGQLQRISIARALALRPRILICDEPVSALDVSVQAQILNLLADLKAEFRPAVLFITHDLGVVRSIADRILVLHKGAVVEEGPAARVLADPQDDYTRRLLAAEPRC